MTTTGILKSAPTEGVSQLGLLVKLPARIPVGEEVEVIRSEMNDPIEVSILKRAQVVWNDSNDGQGPYWHAWSSLSPL
jgi:hypothetical protein